ncbi:flavodoxin [Alkalicoccobacillus porphyridii]|uniref:Flavodoxin n=1 Tax=Alkalicoccobacillus porphyridii TaxID=2597270 RepID=A0A553ZVV0_9BACI|nr:flavodoxin [Alkalicoccobacillus porphyridii]TSB45587.1 flavodoxin [Alkalicoccobacillus porphyridii]
MSKIVLVFASMSGNTEDIADLITGKLRDKGFEVDLEEMEDYDPENLAEYDGIVLGSYTWGDGDLPYEADDFYEALGDVDLSAKPAAVFGSGDTVYPEFCEAVHIFERKLTECGTNLVTQGLKIEFIPETDEDFEACERFAEEFAAKLKVRA